MRAIVDDVAARGDGALKDYTGKFDRFDLDRVGLRVKAEEIARRGDGMQRNPLARWNLPARASKLFHRRQLPRDDRFVDALGVELGSRWTAIEAVGLYVPGGTQPILRRC